MTRNKNGSVAVMSILILGVFAVVIGGSIFFGKPQDIKNTDLPSKCYTDLQPSNYVILGKADITEFKTLNEIKIIGKEHELSTGQASSTGSMRPSIPDKSIIIFINNLTRKDILVGDIISIDRGFGKKDLLHRVIEIIHENETTFYKTKGDNNNIPDDTLWNINQIDSKVIGVIY